MKTCNICGGTILAYNETFAGDFKPCSCMRVSTESLEAEIKSLAKKIEELEKKIDFIMENAKVATSYTISATPTGKVVETGREQTLKELFNSK